MKARDISGNKKIKVYLQQPWKQTDSSYYKYLLENPPKDIEYFPKKEKGGVIQNQLKLKLNNWLKKEIKKIIRMFYPSMPNAHCSKSASRYNMIHCAHCLSKNELPWICDVEYVGQFWAGGYGKNFPNKKKILKYLQSNYCKNILAWTNWAKNEIVREFPSVKNKIKVVYPAIPIRKMDKKNIKENKIRLLFISRRFYFKGGLYAVEVMDKLTKKYPNVFATIISDMPQEIIDKYSTNKKIKFSCLVSQKELFDNIYPSHNIFVYPSFTDTFGFGILEAMSFGLPIISVEGYSRKEIIGQNCGRIAKFDTRNLTKKTLRIIDYKLLQEIMSLTEEFIKNSSLRKKISENCINEVRQGKFSVKNRNEKFEKIYRAALK